MAIVIISGRVYSNESISFSRQIRPILVRHCFACHGPDQEQRQADLRLDTQAGSRVDLGDGPIIKPRDPGASQLLLRVTSSDPKIRMPPAEEAKPLTPQEIRLLRTWISEGATYQKHWSFVPPRRPSVPRDLKKEWSRNPIDDFVLARLQAAGLQPSKSADRLTLARRVYMDLIGLPPTPEQADAFVADQRPDAYRRLVDQLLASSHYGEHWAQPWLDAARYADTNGYEKDRPRSIWPYRDWVIRSLNQDLSFDQFTIEQLAGDMLPDASAEQRIATGFHRNTMLNEEGGIDPLEYRYYAMVDRVATTGTVWLGLTLGCAQCHAHKYDPLTHTDYYRFMALLNNADEPDLLVPDPLVASRRSRLQSQIDQRRRQLPQSFPPDTGTGSLAERRARHLEQRFKAWLEVERGRAVDWRIMRPQSSRSNLPRLELLSDGSVFSSGDITKRDVYRFEFELDQWSEPLTALRIEVLPDERLPAGGPGRAFYEGRKGDFFLSEIVARRAGRALTFRDASHSYGKISIGNGGAAARNVIDGDGSTGWSTSGQEGRANQIVLNLAQPLPPQGTLELELLFERHFAASLGRLRIAGTSSTAEVRARRLPVAVEQMLVTATPPLKPTDRRQLLDYFVSVAPELQKARRQIATLEKQLPEFPSTMVLQERSPDNPRRSFVHLRGEYLRRGKEVRPGVPGFLPGLPSGEPANRLGLARWLVSERNPLTARVTVNRAWRSLFGYGLVRTDGDFGTQAPLPTHPLLLDWLACEFMDSGWSLKSLHRLIVSSATYRQSSAYTQQLLSSDPANQLLARGPRYRISGESLRDTILAASGLLSQRIGGPSVFPPQPASVTALAYGNTAWRASTGADRYRRSLYTFSKRTAPFAANTVFDGPTGENCTVRRDRSNTPLQALTLLNDEMFQEMSRALAKSVLAESGSSDHQIGMRIFRRLLTRIPTPREMELLLQYRKTQLLRLQSGALSADEIAASAGASNELASWMIVARSIMNLDETLTKQ